MGKKIVKPIRIDVDSSVNRRDANSLYEAKNLRPTNLDELKFGEYSNIKGTNLVFNSDSTKKILKLAKVGSKIIMFIKTSDVTNNNIIGLIDESSIVNNGTSAITINLSYYYWQPITNGAHKVIAGNFGFDEEKPIDVTTYYESDYVQKVYWNIEGEPMRGLNIAYSTQNNPSLYTDDDLLIIPTISLNQPVINKTIPGNLTCGKIFYTYRLVHPMGAETQLSELSFPFHLTKSDNTLASDLTYKGYGIDVNSLKGINLSISNIDSKYKRIKIYSIHYIDDSSLPKVSLVYDNNVSESITINDVGSPILDISPEEFVVEYLNFTGGTKEIKNNRQFVANYVEEYFDIDDYADDDYWDARAYRFNSSGVADIYDKDLSTHYSIDPGTLDEYEDIPSDFDCINTSNARDLSTLTYVYKSSGSVIGAEGLNVSISQLHNKYVYPDYGTSKEVVYGKKVNTSSSIPSTGLSSYANPTNDSKYKSFKPEEVYRLGIQFKSGQKYSYVKWICDYRYIYDSDDLLELSGTQNLLMKIQSLYFSVSNIPTDPTTGSSFEYRIVYVPITDDDEGVHWGFFNSLRKATFDGVQDNQVIFIVKHDGIQNKFFSEYLIYRDDPYITDNLTYTDNGKYVEFVSPDYCFGNKKQYSKIRLLKFSPKTDVISNATATLTDQTFKQAIFEKIYDLTDYASFSIGYSNVDAQYDIEYDNDITGTIQLDGSDVFTRTSVCRTGYTNDSIPPKINSISTGYANKGRCQIIKPSVQLTGELNSISFGCAYVDDFLSKYGGISYEARLNNYYTPLSEFTSSPTLTVYGDCYLGVFEYLRMMSENDSAFVKEDEPRRCGNPEIVYFPAITRINLKLRSDEKYSDIYKTNGSYMIHEHSGVYSDDSAYNDPQNYIFTQNTDLYLYNKTYSRHDTVFMYGVRQSSYLNSKQFKTRVNASEQKIIGETSDSFIKFSPNTYIDVDGRYGEIISLNNFNDRLYFFQENAYGIISTNERSLMNDSNGDSIGVGEINLLARRDYIDINNGILNKNHVKVASNSMYVIDSMRKEIIRIGSEGIEKISTTKNVKNILNSNYWDDSIIIYNRKYNEIFFTYKETSASTAVNCLIFNERINEFTAIYTFPDILVDSVELNKISTGLYDEIVLNDSYDLYTLNDGEYNKFNGTYYPSEITFIVPSENEQIVLFNLIEIIIKQIDSSDNAVNFIDTIQIYTDTQDTGELDFDGSCVLSLGKYRTNKLRNYSDPKKKRINSDHLFVKIKTTDNTSNNYRVFFRDLIASYSEYNYYG